MNFFTVWWFDVLLGGVLLFECLTLWSRTFGKNIFTPLLTTVFTAVTVVIELGSIAGLFYLRATLTDLLIVLMMYALLMCITAICEVKYENAHQPIAADEESKEDGKV